MTRRDANRTASRDSENIPALNQFTSPIASQAPAVRMEDPSNLRVRAPLLDKLESTNVAGRVPHPTNHYGITGTIKETSCIPVQTVPSQLISTAALRTTHVLSSGLVIEVETTECHDLNKFPDMFNKHTVARTASPEPTHNDYLHDDESSLMSDETANCAAPYAEEWDTYPPGQRDDYFFDLSQDLTSQLGHSRCTISDGLAQCQAAITAQPLVVTTASSELGHDDDSRLDSDAVSLTYGSIAGRADVLCDLPPHPCLHASEQDNFPPGQGGDYYFNQQIKHLGLEIEPFYLGDTWRLKFIPTILMFLGSRSNPWDWSGDTFVSLLRHVWTIVYGDTAWSDEDGYLVCSLATESVAAWFDSFASTALAAIEIYLKRSTDGRPSFSQWSMLCKKMVHDGTVVYECPDGANSPGTYGSPFVLAPLAAHMQAIRGAVQGVTGDDDDDQVAFPYGAVGLAAAAAFRAAMLVGMELVEYDGDGSLVIKAPPTDGLNIPTMNTLFTQSTAGGTAREFSTWARSLEDHGLCAILSRANAFSLDLSAPG